MKPGWKTTEFWCTVLASLASILEYFPRWSGAAAILSYIASRCIVKSTGGQ